MKSHSLRVCCNLSLFSAHALVLVARTAACQRACFPHQQPCKKGSYVTAEQQEKRHGLASKYLFRSPRSQMEMVRLARRNSRFWSPQTWLEISPGVL